MPPFLFPPPDTDIRRCIRNSFPAPAPVKSTFLLLGSARKSLGTYRETFYTCFPTVSLSGPQSFPDMPPSLSAPDLKSTPRSHDLSFRDTGPPPRNKSSQSVFLPFITFFPLFLLGKRNQYGKKLFLHIPLLQQLLICI